ncbi:MAG: transglycosylase SLT domain-containing protein [Candidatus Muirbacterium halophilum]|nr:transglycosylase SLT domain-containing protein [Candidatus Muirbacterium halophilum]
MANSLYAKSINDDKKCTLPWLQNKPQYSKIFSKPSSTKGNCIVKGDNGKIGICHYPSEATTTTYKYDLQNKKYDFGFIQAQKETGIDWRYLKAIAYQETRLAPNAMTVIGDKGNAKGLFQFTKSQINGKINYGKSIGIYVDKTKIFSDPTEASKLCAVWIFSVMNQNEVKHILQNKHSMAYIPSDPFYYTSKYNGMADVCKSVHGKKLTGYGNIVMYYFKYISNMQNSNFAYADNTIKQTRANTLTFNDVARYKLPMSNNEF